MMQSAFLVLQNTGAFIPYSPEAILREIVKSLRTSKVPRQPHSHATKNPMGSGVLQHSKLWQFPTHLPPSIVQI